MEQWGSSGLTPGTIIDYNLYPGYYPLEYSTAEDSQYSYGLVPIQQQSSDNVLPNNVSEQTTVNALEILTTTENTNISEILESEVNNATNDLNNLKRTRNEFESNDEFPSELVSMFQSLLCKLCMAKMTSIEQARMHYQGRQHLRKQHQWLLQYAQSKGLPLPKKQKITKHIHKPKTDVEITIKSHSVENSDSLVDNPDRYCSCCEIIFTSQQHAQQHYAGRNHRRVLEGKKPLKTGPPEETHPVHHHKLKSLLKKHHLKKVNNELPMSESAIVNDVVSTEKIIMKRKRKKGGKYLSEINLKHTPNVSSLTHKSNTDLTLDSINIPLPISGMDLNEYRIPSGHLFCSTCNVKVKNEAQFLHHLNSKKHQINFASLFRAKLS